MSGQEGVPIIDVANVSMVYDSHQGPVTALKDVSLEINAGEFICLVGPSGCGKSTLLKLIAGYLQPTKGNCRMAGAVISKPDWQRGVVFQTSMLYPWLSVRDNIEYGPKVRKKTPAECREISDFYLEQVGLRDFGDSHTFELSGGMKQRVSLARALANQPEIILMDEPFSALDAITKVKMQRFLRKLWQENQQTLLLITHDIDEALSLGTKVAVMSKGTGEIEEVITVPYSQKILATKDYQVELDQNYIQDKLAILKMIS